MNQPEIREGYFGRYGGRFVSELLIPALEELTTAFKKYSRDSAFKKEYNNLLREFAGRPTLMYHARNISEKWGADVYLKREDLLHTGSHKINNCLGQALLAKKLKKPRVIAETGAGQHGVATATAAALMKLECCVYMGNEDLRRQALNGFRMRLLGAFVVGAGDQMGTLRDAVNEALRDWSSSVDHTHYIVGSVIGPHPFPSLVKWFHAVIGRESKKQIIRMTGKLPDAVFACVGGGSNAMGMFSGFLAESGVDLIGAEAGGTGMKKGEHSSTLKMGKPGVLQGCYTYVLQNKAGIVDNVHSISAGLDYPGVGPEHAHLLETGRAKYVAISDDSALAAFQELSETEGIIPALESSHALAAARNWVFDQKKLGRKKPMIVINLSGRGDKDAAEAQRLMEKQGRVFQ
ncbi:MAG: tryptophan synthase subunit beta [Leptospiraceae bacterium]|nr:tryptophan synthase subunit beta [Leptospiraceae bacterium]